MNIRKEELKDYAEIYEVVKAAFKSAEHSDGNEQDLVNKLRAGESYISELSLVAEENGRIIPPFDVPDKIFMAYSIGENPQCIHGVIKYAKEFGIE